MTIRFTGRTRAETKRKALGYWVNNQDRLRISMKEFVQRCAMSAEGTTIVFNEEVQKEKRPLWLRLRVLSRV